MDAHGMQRHVPSPEREKKRETANELFKRGEFLTALRYWLALAGDRAHLCFPIPCTLGYLHQVTFWLIGKRCNNRVGCCDFIGLTQESGFGKRFLFRSLR